MSRDYLIMADYASEIPPAWKPKPPEPLTMLVATLPLELIDFIADKVTEKVMEAMEKK